MLRRFRFSALLALAYLSLSPLSFAADVWRNDDFDYTTQVFRAPTFNGTVNKVPESVHTIAVLPVDLGDSVSLIPNPTSAAARIEVQAAERIAAVGYKVILADEMRKIIAEADASVGDLYDARTGRPNGDRIQKRRDLIWKTYQERYAPDAFLLMAVLARRAEVYQFKAGWDGIEENVSGRGGLADFWTGPAQQFATVPGLSLGVWLVKPDKQLIYGSIGGLHLIAYIRQIDGHPAYLEVARSEAVVADSRIGRALDVALLPAFPKPASTGKSKERRPAPVSYPQAPVSGGPAEGAPPFVTAEQFRARYKKIVLTPVLVPDVPNRAEIQLKFEGILRKQLEAAGYSVVGSDVFLENFEKEAKKQETVYDTRTGHIDLTKFNAVRDRAFEKVRQELQADVLLMGSVLTRPALFSGTEAHWQGASQVVTGDVTGLAAKLSGGGGKVGTVPAAVFRVEVLDPANTVLYEGLGGIELLAWVAEKGFKEVAPSDRFQNAQRNETGVSLALTDLLTVQQKRN